MIDSLLSVIRSEVSLVDLVDWAGTIGCLVAMVLYFKRRLLAVQEKLEECEHDRESLHIKCAELQTIVSTIQKKMTS